MPGSLSLPVENPMKIDYSTTQTVKDGNKTIETTTEHSVNVAQSASAYLNSFRIDGKTVKATNDAEFHDTKRPDGILYQTYAIPPTADRAKVVAGIVDKLRAETAGRDLALVEVPDAATGEKKLVVLWADELDFPSSSPRGTPVTVSIPDAEGQPQEVQGELVMVKDEEDEDGSWAQIQELFMAFMGALLAIGGLATIILSIPVIAGPGIFTALLGGVLLVGGADMAWDAGKAMLHPDSSDERASSMLKAPVSTGVKLRNT